MSTLTKMIEAMAQAEGAFAYTAERFGPAPISAARDEAGMKAALLWLADNVSDEMVNVIAHATSGDEYRQRPEEDFNDWTRRLRKAAISAALRAAAGDKQ